MTSLFAARRAAEEFAELVDAPADARRGGIHHAHTTAGLLPTVQALRAQTSVAPRAEFVADLRARLMAAADTALAPATVPERTADLLRLPPRTASSRIGTAAAAALVVIGGTTGLAAAAQGSLPGDTLYPVKRGIENAVGALNTSDAGRGADLLGEAGHRLDEAQSLSLEKAPASRIRDALADFQSSADNGADLLFTSYQAHADGRDIATVQQFTDESQGTLDALALTAPDDAQPSIESARATLEDIARQAQTLCASCGGDDFTLSSFGTLGATRFRALITQPVRDADARDAELAVQELRREQEALAAAAEEASRTTPETVLPSPSPSQTDDGTGTTVPGTSGITSRLGGGDSPGVKAGTEALTAVTTPVKSTLTGTTDGVTGLISEVTGSTPLAPVTDPLTDTLDQTVDGVTGLLP